MLDSAFTPTWGASSASMPNRGDPILAADRKKGCETTWHHAKVCRNGCHRRSSLWFGDVTSMCPVFQTSPKQVTFILALEVGQIDHARVNCWCCTLQYFIWPGQEWNKMVLWFYDHSIVHGFRSPVRGVLPILFAPHVPRIGIFCLTHRCWPVLLPAGSIRSSSPSGWYENCFKPMALQVRGSPLRPYRSASVFSRPCRCPCWGKTGRNCISQGHSWKLTYLLKDLCIFFWGGCCNVNFGMVDLAAQTVWLHWMRCQSFRNTFDQMTGSHSNSPGKYDRDYGFPKDSWYSIGDSWRKKCESMERHPAKVCQKGCYRLASLWFWWAATQAWWQCVSRNGVCCNSCNCLTELNEKSIFQDFTRSNDSLTLQ